MPFTPVHMGPGIAIKAAMQDRFSLMVFGWSQIVIDLQPLFVLLTQKGELHGFSHSFLGATLIGLFCALTGKAIAEFGLHLIQQTKHLTISWVVSFISAFIGAYSHIFIDSIMHWDVLPLSPISTQNPLHGIISIGALHLGCLGCAVFGGFIIYIFKNKWEKA